MRQNIHKKVVDVILIIFMFASLLQAQSFEEIYLPIAIACDGVKSDKIIACDMSYILKGIEYDMPVKEYVGIVESRAEKYLSHIIEDIRKQDIQDAMVLAYPKSHASLGKQDENRISTIMPVLSRAFNDDMLRLYYQIKYDKNYFFVFGLPNTKQYFGLTISEDKDESLFWNSTIASPVTGGIISSVMHGDVVSRKSPQKQYQYQIPVTDPNMPDVIRIGFNGRPYLDMSYLSLADNLDKSASMMLQLYISAQTGHLYEMSGCFTPRSQEWFLSLFEPEKKTELENFKNKLNTKPDIAFVIDANPLYIVLHQRKRANLSFLFLQEILCEDGLLKFTDFHYNNFLTQTLLSDTAIKGLGSYIPRVSGMTGAFEMR